MKRDLRSILWLGLLISCWPLRYLRNPSSELELRPLPHLRVINLETVFSPVSKSNVYLGIPSKSLSQRCVIDNMFFKRNSVTK